MSTRMDGFLHCSEVKKWKMYTYVLEEFVFCRNFPQVETCWLYQSANVTNVPDLIDGKILPTRCVFRLEKG